MLLPRPQPPRFQHCNTHGQVTSVKVALQNSRVAFCIAVCLVTREEALFIDSIVFFCIFFIPTVCYADQAGQLLLGKGSKIGQLFTISNQQTQVANAILRVEFGG